MDLVLKLKDAKKVKRAGGKAVALAELINAGFKVPNGFVITTSAYQKMDGALENEILKFFDELGAKHVAVRSSAAAEDGKSDAWAGQLDTFLNVTRAELIESIKECWESINSDRAKSYADQKKIKAGKVAVLIQAMVQGDVSGIAFSVNPVTNNASEMVIEAGFGLNEPIVSGEITPDTYVIDKTNLEILQRQVSIQPKKYVLGKSGKNEWQKVAESENRKLRDAQILDVAAATMKLEKYFGYPVDVEWTFAKNKLNILQSRPVTTL